MSGPASQLVHASCVRWLGHGVLIVGASGSGKSSLALQLVLHGADLVADDQVALAASGDGPGSGSVVAKPVALPGHLEVRGHGIVLVASRARVRLSLVVRLAGAMPDRLPEPAPILLCGQPVPTLTMATPTTDAPARVAAALLAPRMGEPS